MAIEELHPDYLDEKRMKTWSDLTCYFALLVPGQQRAMLVRAGPRILGMYDEWGYHFDGLDDAKKFIAEISP